MARQTFFQLSFIATITAEFIQGRNWNTVRLEMFPTRYEEEEFVPPVGKRSLTLTKKTWSRICLNQTHCYLYPRRCQNWKLVTQVMFQKTSAVPGKNIKKTMESCHSLLTESSKKRTIILKTRFSLRSIDWYLQNKHSCTAVFSVEAPQLIDWTYNNWF